MTQEITTMSFEHAMQELEQIVRRMETGEATLEQSLNDYARGTSLRAHCQTLLSDAKLKVEQMMNEGGNLSTQPFENA
ncbi:MAG: exodeoxyribonuclease VII small subunit [Alphaproteobacteria bacterium]|nr:MAG: exodeoxyribonuclease VII small subunit [Alphaproteobacteria bacterium]TAF14085.1 MAG: exodeoxyribonuclease VII small subunit [Alphaproteobacteria bacterium]TAF39792.1 MAG: exodeoxyribonuclease VII small subunit [Alphaproteobacteria bacterium]